MPVGISMIREATTNDLNPIADIIGRAWQKIRE
jgi:N-acetylglutamate synthase-like GNAT family acetyltransferase